MLKFFVDIISSFAKLLEVTLQFEFKELELIGGQEILIETVDGDSFKYSKDHQNFRNLLTMFFARRVEPALFK